MNVRPYLLKPLRWIVNVVIPACYCRVPTARCLAVELQFHFPAQQNILPSAGCSWAQYEHIGAVRLDLRLISPEALSKFTLNEVKKLGVLLGIFCGGFSYFLEHIVEGAGVQTKQQFTHIHQLHSLRTFH